MKLLSTVNKRLPLANRRGSIIPQNVLRETKTVKYWVHYNSTFQNKIPISCGHESCIHNLPKSLFHKKEKNRHKALESRMCILFWKQFSKKVKSYDSSIRSVAYWNMACQFPANESMPVLFLSMGDSFTNRTPTTTWHFRIV